MAVRAWGFEGDREIAGVGSRFIGSHAGSPEQARLGLRQCASAVHSRYSVKACRVAERVGNDRMFWLPGCFRAHTRK